jgi:hypothetical protein
LEFCPASKTTVISAPPLPRAAAAEGQLQSSRISSDGVYVVGKDIKPVPITRTAAALPRRHDD